MTQQGAGSHGCGGGVGRDPLEVVCDLVGGAVRLEGVVPTGYGAWVVVGTVAYDGMVMLASFDAQNDAAAAFLAAVSASG